MTRLGITLVRVFTIVFLFILFHAQVAFCENTLAITTVNEQRQSIRSQYEYIEDPKGTFDFNQVINGQVGQFKPLLNKNLGFGYKSVLWIRFSANFKDYPDPFWFLFQGYEHVGELSLFYPTLDGYQSMNMMENEPAYKKTFDIHNYIFKVPTPATQTAVYYMRFNPQGHVLTIDLFSSGIKGMIEFMHQSMLGLGLFFGALMVMWFYNFMLFLSLRSKEYFYYLYYLFCFIGTFIYLNGFAPLLIDSPALYEPLFAMFSYGAIHGMTIFARQFLSLKTTVRWLDIYLSIMQWILFVGGLSVWFEPVGTPYPLLNILIVFTMPMLMVAGGIRMKHGYTPARIYTAGWAVFSLSIVIYTLRLFAILPATFLTNYAIQLASIWETILFAIALAYRLKLIERKTAMAKTAFLGMISHELKTPLQGICSAIDLLSMRMPQNDEIMNRLKTSTEHLEIQVKDLTDYAHLESGKLQFRKATFNASQMMRQAVAEFSTMAANKRLDIRINIEGNVVISSDIFRLRQILNNLISTKNRENPLALAMGRKAGI
jgi:two-component system, sensor histidine kinase LadS